LALKEYASDLQTFLGSKSIEVEVEKQERFVESLSISLSNVPSLFRIKSFCLELLSVNNILPLGQIIHPKIELSDDRNTTLVEDVKLPNQSFITTFGDKIFQTNHKNNSVTCYTINGVSTDCICSNNNLIL
jgi:hypothetical protein